MSIAAVSAEGLYMYTYHGPKVESLNVSAAESIGEYAFSYCRNLVDITINPEIKEIPKYAFAGCDALKTINLENVTKIDEYAFMECGLENVNISAVETVGDYAFVSNRKLASVKFSENGTDIGEGAFSYCDPLATVENINFAENIGDYAFAYTAITEVDLTAAVAIGKNVFLKEELTPFKVTLGEDVEKIGDNPFAMCIVEPFSKIETEKVNGVEKEVVSYNFEISDTVFVIDGSLYCNNIAGMELITYAGIDNENVVVADDTIRVTALAFAGSDVVRVKMPFTTVAIGHKAFYACDKLEMVTFGSYTAPNFEEEFDPAYYESLNHVPGTGDYGTYTDYNGNEVPIVGIGVVDYFIWNATGGMYSNVFYGANFVDYIGYVEDKLTMVKPVNGIGYDSFICDQYFDLTIDGPAAPDETAVDAINAIKAIPKKVSYEDKALVEAARDAYSKIATLEQMSLVVNYSDLVSAEQRIKALAPTESGDEGAPAPAPGVDAKSVIIAVAIAVISIAAVAVIVYITVKKNRSHNYETVAGSEAKVEVNDPAEEKETVEEEKENGDSNETEN